MLRDPRGSISSKSLRDNLKIEYAHVFEKFLILKCTCVSIGAGTVLHEVFWNTKN